MPEDIHSARAYFLQIVIPQYESALVTLQDGTMGFRRDTIAVGNSALACLHMADHTCRDPACAPHIPESPRTSEYLKRLLKDDQLFSLVHDVAICFKHRRATRDGAVVKSLDDIREQYAVVRYRDDDGYYYGIRKLVLVKDSAGNLISAIDILREVVVGWAHRLIAIGSLPKNASNRDA